MALGQEKSETAMGENGMRGCESGLQNREKKVENGTETKRA